MLAAGEQRRGGPRPKRRKPRAESLAKPNKNLQPNKPTRTTYRRDAPSATQQTNGVRRQTGLTHREETSEKAGEEEEEDEEEEEQDELRTSHP